MQRRAVQLRHHLPKTLRRASAAGVVLLITVIGCLATPKSTDHAVQAALAPTSTYSPNSPHWSHIHIATLGRLLKYLPSGTIKTSGQAWFAGHIDMMETAMDTLVYRYADGTESSTMKSLNSTFKTYGYDFDLTMCQHIGCYGGGQTNTVATTSPEKYFLHFSEDTHLKFVALDGSTVAADVFVPGCPDSGPTTFSCRAQEYMWTDARWPVNVKDTSWQQWYAAQLLDETMHDANNRPNTIDGIFLDEHGIGYAFSHAIGTQTIILSGGGIREYQGQKPQNISGLPQDALDIQYTADVNSWLAYARSRFDAVEKFLMPNTAEYFMNPLLFTENVAAKGVYTELLHAPDHFRFGASMYQQFISQVQQLSAAGGIVQLAYGPCDSGPNGYTAGDYSTTRERYSMWNLASYYMTREFPSDSGRVYFDPNLCVNPEGPNPLDFEQQWLTAYENDVGTPLDTATIYQHGTQSCDPQEYAVFARHYTKALVLVRPRGGYGCTDYSDASAVNVDLPSSMVMLNPDGSTSAPMESVVIRNGEAVILFPSPDITSPSTTTNLHTQ